MHRHRQTTTATVANLRKKDGRDFVGLGRAAAQVVAHLLQVLLCEADALLVRVLVGRHGGVRVGRALGLRLEQRAEAARLLFRLLRGLGGARLLLGWKEERVSSRTHGTHSHTRSGQKDGEEEREEQKQ